MAIIRYPAKTETELKGTTATKGGQKYLFTKDINELFTEILIELRIITAQNNEAYDLTMSEKDVR